MKNTGMILAFLLVVTLVCSCSPGKDKPVKELVKSVEYYLPMWEDKDPPDIRVDMLHFHHTVQCNDCSIIGNAVLALLKEEYQQECEEGQIVYRSVNSDLLENKPLLDHYEVLEEDFIISIVNGEKETVVHDEAPFRLAREGKDLTPYLRKVITERLKALQ